VSSFVDSSLPRHNSGSLRVSSCRKSWGRCEAAPLNFANPPIVPKVAGDVPWPLRVLARNPQPSAIYCCAVPARRVHARMKLMSPQTAEPSAMSWWHYLVEIKRVKELALPTFLPPHHGPLPRITSHSRNHGSTIASTRVLQHIPPEYKRVKELALPTFLPPHHGPLPRITSHSRNHGSTIASTRVLQHIPPESRHRRSALVCLYRARLGHSAPQLKEALKRYAAWRESAPWGF
jgi:hypothetical protein